MVRSLINNAPDWAIGLIFVGGFVALGVIGKLIVRRALPSWSDERATEGTSVIAGITMTLFALLLALVVVNLYSSYSNASDNVASEASSLSQLYQDAHAFPSANRDEVYRAMATYVDEVRNHEFKALRSGNDDPLADEKLFGVVKEVQRYTPSSETQIGFYDAAITKVNEVVVYRRNVTDEVDSAIPGVFIVLLLVLGLLSIGVTFFVKTHSTQLDVTYVVVVASVVGLGVFTALVLQYPFSGQFSVSSDPLVSGVLHHLLASPR